MRGFVAEESKFTTKGMVTVSDGSGLAQPMLLHISRDTVTLQKEELVYITASDSPADSRERVVKISRHELSGLGLSIKGGSEHKLPILISRIFKNQAAEKTGHLFVGDAIIKVNDINVEGSRHDDAVKVLREAGDDVLLTVRHYRAAAPFLKGAASKLPHVQDDPHTSPTLRIQDKEKMEEQGKLEKYCHATEQSTQSSVRLEKRWKDAVTLPLLLAYVTRYVLGTNKLRLNGFEVYSMDFSKTTTVFCEDDIAVRQWVYTISNSIAELTNQQMKAFNKTLPPADQVLYMGWVTDGSGDIWMPCFFTIKGSDVRIFEKPPLTKNDWSSSRRVFKIYHTTIKTLRECDQDDESCNWFILQTASGESFYLATEQSVELGRIEAAWHRATYNAVSRLGSQTFTVMCRNQTAALTLDWNSGFALYNTENKCYLWKYRFSQLKGSADNGRTRLKLHFHDPDTREIETKEIECSQLQLLLFCMHAFLTAKVVSIDPNFVCSS